MPKCLENLFKAYGVTDPAEQEYWTDYGKINDETFRHAASLRVSSAKARLARVKHVEERWKQGFRLPDLVREMQLTPKTILEYLFEIRYADPEAVARLKELNNRAYELQREWIERNCPF